MNFQDKLLFWFLSTGISHEQGMALIEGNRRLKFSVDLKDPFGVVQDVVPALYSLGADGEEAIGLLQKTEEQLMLATYLKE